MLKYILSLLNCIFFLIGAFAQHELGIFDKLMDKTWKAEGNWGDGSKFIQETTFSYALDSTMVIAKSNGFVNKAQTEQGLRNYGIRQYDPVAKTLKFWEFDVFGGVTEGTVRYSDNDIWYQYAYGEDQVTDMWEYVNDSTYNFTVGSYDNGNWKQKYLTTRFYGARAKPMEAAYQNLKRALQGKWTAKAWDGMLTEEWYIDPEGNLRQQAQYWVNDKIAYEASNKIELIDGQLVLITLIKDGNPKIFQATACDKQGVRFENSDYGNPNAVSYRIKSNNEFEREILGVENNKPETYTFQFKRIVE